MELTSPLLYTTPNGTLSAFFQTPPRKTIINKRRNSIQIDVGVTGCEEGMEGVSQHVLF
jgi:hypothetical protein